jgi:hypothetical protein
VISRNPASPPIAQERKTSQRKSETEEVSALPKAAMKAVLSLIKWKVSICR